MKKTITYLLLFSIYFGMFSPVGNAIKAQSAAATADGQEEPRTGLSFRLSEGKESAETPETTPPAKAEPLSADETNGVVGRLPKIGTQDGDEQDAALRAGSLPAPKKGEKIPVPFPGKGDADRPQIDTTKELAVVRYAPQGKVELAPDMSLTFSEPMIAVTSQEEASKTVPVELTPQIEGQWHWLGTRTLRFEPAKRLPMATEFKARVPAGTRSATGKELKKDFVWTFSTPAPTMKRTIPSNSSAPWRRDQLMYIAFDQAIDPAAVLANVTVRGGANKSIRTRLATAEEVAADGSISLVSKQEQPGRWLAFRAVTESGGTDALPPDSWINVSVNAGTPSVEGPLKTEKAQEFSFKTYGAMKLTRHYCRYPSPKGCYPSDPFVLQFSNPIESKNFDKSMVKIEPALEMANIFASGTAIYINGWKDPNTTYTVTVASTLPDTFGQKLEKEASVKFEVTNPPPSLMASNKTMQVLDPFGLRQYSVYTINIKELSVKLYAVRPEDWPAYTRFLRNQQSSSGEKAPMPGELVVDTRVKVAANSMAEMAETKIGLDKILKGGFGNVVVDVRDTAPPDDRYYQRRKIVWLQSTNIGLDAFVDSNELVGFATDLRTGKALSGVDLRIAPNGREPQTTAATENSWFANAWAWISSWGTTDPQAATAVDENGDPLTITSIPEPETQRSSATGLARLSLPASQSETENLLIARLGKDTAFLPQNPQYYWQQKGNWYEQPADKVVSWFVFDDRKLYKPNEEISAKGWVRYIDTSELGDVEKAAEITADAKKVSYVVTDSRGAELGKGEADLNAFGAFDLKAKLPDNANLGYAQIGFSLRNKDGVIIATFSHSFQIQEFRRPEYEVKAKMETEGPYMIKGSATAALDAKYFSGGGLANAPVKWTVTANATNYTPPNRDDFSFGVWTPWWIYRYDGNGDDQRQRFEGKTDKDGRHLLKIDLDAANPPRPYRVSASGAVTDVNRQTWAGSTNFIVHPSSLYVGIRTPRTFVQKGETIKVESIVTDIDGKLQAGRKAEIKAYRLVWTNEKGNWIEKKEDPQTCSVTSAETAQTCSFVANGGGRYKITARVQDDRERPNESELTIWVPGGEMPKDRDLRQQKAEIIPSQKDYKPGDTAELLVLSPFTPAEGVLTLRRNGIVSTQHFRSASNSITLKVPILDAYLPNIEAQVDLVGVNERDPGGRKFEKPLPPQPAYAGGSISLNISTESRRLSVTADPVDSTLVPGGKTKLNVAVKDNAGEPAANTEVAVVVVDESVLYLAGYEPPDPLPSFYSKRGTGVQDLHSRDSIEISDSKDVAGAIATNLTAKQIEQLPKGRAFSSLLLAAPSVKAEGLAGGFQIDGASAAENSWVADAVRGEESAITIRQNFAALAAFMPSVRTDSSGKATVDVKLPDNLTRYRIIAIAADEGKRFGKGESSITARKPLMIRPSAPRFLNYGDKAEIPVVIQNQSDKEMTVNVAMRASNVKLLEGADSAAGKQVVVPANDRAEVRFAVETKKPGTARFQFAAVSGELTDAAEISLPVWTPATTEAFATYGTVDQNQAVFQPIKAPDNIIPNFGGVEVTTSSTQLQELTDAYIYLANYPFACSEQLSSRMISTAALRDVLTAFKAKEMPEPEAIEREFKTDMKALASRQRGDGSYGLWTSNADRFPYVFLTVHVTHAMALAKAKGYDVPEEAIERSKPYLKNVERYMTGPWYSSPKVRWTISAYALYVREKLGDRDVAKAKRLLAEATVKEMPYEGLGWLLSAFANDAEFAQEKAEILTFLNNHVTETTSTANFVTSYGDNAWLIMHSNRRADGVLLEALIKADPQNDIIQKLVRGLLAHRVKGAWSNTQENVFILLALDKYFQTYEKITPNFVAKIWLGDTYAGEQPFKGRSVDSKVLNIPMSYLEKGGGSSDLIIDKQGAGRLYYRIGMKYAPANLKLAPADYGFTVLRSYEPVDKPDDVRQNPDGSWTFKTGARVRVRLTMIAESRRYHVALVDPMPAGLEALNPELAATEEIPDDSKRTPVVGVGSLSYGNWWWWYRANWFEHQNFRDERAEAFTSLLWEGVYNYSYVTRATTPGHFVVPPAKAEEMYQPETFGRTGTDSVTIE
ncbi:MAG: Ig-like domain-containing protein [Acidobacteria bacterium]|nr:Ig-like domain-containing protein [Acidobacteriota bacterium]